MSPRSIVLSIIATVVTFIAFAFLPARGSREGFKRLRRVIALPAYTLGLLLDYLSDALGRLGAWIAGDDWP